MSYIKVFTTRGLYTIEELYSCIGNYEFSLGIPELTTNELGKKMIAFQISTEDRILITPDHYSSRTNNWIISREDKNITTFGFVKNALFDDMKIKRPNLFSGVSKPKQNYEIVNNLIQEINSFGL